MNIIVIGLSHHTSPVELRERFAFAEAKIPAALAQLRASGTVAEAVILSTCNRVEIYAATPQPSAKACAEVTDFLVRSGGAQFAPSAENIYALSGAPSLRHLFKVACGLDSMVLGETEILGQLKDAYQLAHQHRHTGARLNKAFQRAFHVAKHVRTNTNIQRGSVSVASVAVELAEKIFSSLPEHPVLIIGAGDTSGKVARALFSRGVKDIIVTSRTPENAETLATEFGGRTIPFEDWATGFDKIDIAISSTASPAHILDRAKLEPLMKLRKHRPLLLVDIAVPRDIDPAVNFLENVYLYNIDDLLAIAADYLKMRKEELAQCEKIIDEKIKPLIEPASEQSSANDGVVRVACCVKNSS
jgi:glutamyl-tRNA reductase